MNKKLHPLAILSILVLLGAGCVLVVPTWRQVALGYVLRDSFFEGMPSSFWVSQMRTGTVTERQRAAHALGQVAGTNPAVLPVLEAALKDEDYSVRKTAAIALGEVGAPARRSVPALLEARKDSSEAVRREVIASLGMIGGEAEEMIPILLSVAKKDGDVHTRVRALSALARYGPAAEALVPDLIAMMKEPEGRDASVPRSAMGVLMKIGPKGVPGVADALSSADAQTRTYAAEALGDMGESAKVALPKIKALLNDPDGYARVVAARVVWKLDPSQADVVVPVLMEGLKRKDKWNVRLDSVVSLGHMGPAAKQAVPALTEMLKDVHDDIRQSTATALAQMGPEARSAIPLLRELVEKDAFPNVSVAAAAALRKIESEPVATTAKP